ncbi:hypothetical protein SADUNF_Sadunf08G0133600 [Salix dunnii]|uniref:Uncharacterized protein n=1 Tax=Salix dunnii TaxID=1413687 RepID=A0A835JYN6_9ROSI|nr:hypothetical protein SADUNF_Sadunf08G0133600 [Salix dunnii]
MNFLLNNPKPPTSPHAVVRLQPGGDRQVLRKQTPPAYGLNVYHFIPSTKLCLLTTQPCTTTIATYVYKEYHMKS